MHKKYTINFTDGTNLVSESMTQSNKTFLKDGKIPSYIKLERHNKILEIDYITGVIKVNNIEIPLTLDSEKLSSCVQNGLFPISFRKRVLVMFGDQVYPNAEDYVYCLGWKSNVNGESIQRFVSIYEWRWELCLQR